MADVHSVHCFFTALSNREPTGVKEVNYSVYFTNTNTEIHGNLVYPMNVTVWSEYRLLHVIYVYLYL